MEEMKIFPFSWRCYQEQLYRILSVCKNADENAEIHCKTWKNTKKNHWKINSFSINHNWWSIKMCNKIFILNIVIIFHLWFIERNISITHSTVNSPFLNLNSKFIREKLNNYHQIKWNFSIFEQNLKEVWKNQINNVIRSISNIPLL